MTALPAERTIPNDVALLRLAIRERDAAIRRYRRILEEQDAQLADRERLVAELIAEQ
ncbi:hypothetical protein [Mycolicibacterium brisbanense]|uniref:Uncharacterized protein n=1 Tax=Mycolicibacterium brisbanense TaxID=146020 RepID=A0A100VZJ8_9MYCO|nr:hypothetical protein [Mycolicibacterium brisbanense]MCV7156134.1 hypothetical protein [Mycolicibacterium brisbanense]GAS88891.1 putative uncharacterized protein [Mycolicibacterium brisbanense]